MRSGHDTILKTAPGRRVLPAGEGPLKVTSNPEVPARLAKEVERVVRRLGLPLETVELLFQDAKVARDFLRAAREGRAPAYVQSLDARALERALAARELGRKGASPTGVSHHQ